MQRGQMVRYKHAVSLRMSPFLAFTIDDDKLGRLRANHTTLYQIIQLFVAVVLFGDAVCVIVVGGPARA